MLGLVALLREHWAAIQDKTAVRSQELEAAERSAERLLTAGLREQGPVALTAAVAARRRAYTLLDQASPGSWHTVTQKPAKFPGSQRVRTLLFRASMPLMELPGSSLIRRKLMQAVVQGATLASLAAAASCSSDSVANNPQEPQDSNTPDATATMNDSAPDVTTSNDPDATSNDSAPDNSTPPDAPDAPGSLPPYDVDRLGCWGPSFDGGYMGQCCVKAHCYTPEGGTGCATAQQIAMRAFRTTPPYPPGSGTCTCRLGEGTQEYTAGPFAANPADPARPEGACCYLVGSISCVGRPLMVEGVPLLAEVVARSDWAPFA